jgi:hypothetical protein
VHDPHHPGGKGSAECLAPRSPLDVAGVSIGKASNRADRSPVFFSAVCLPRLLGKVGGITLFLQLASAPAESATCSDLTALKLPKGTIASAQMVNAGAFLLPSNSPSADSSFFTAWDRPHALPH